MRAHVLLSLCVLSSCGPQTGTNSPCAALAAGDLVITEVMIDPNGTDTGSEWLEVFNRLGSPVELKGLTLYTRDLDGSGAKSHVLRAGTVAARSYFVMGDVRSGPNPAWVNYSYATALSALGNAHGVLGLRCGMSVIDEMSWNRTARAGRSRMLDGSGEPDAIANDSEAAWCDTPTALSFGSNAGTPGEANPACTVEAALGSCLENGQARPVVPPQPGDLVITEVMASPAKATDTLGEWFEVLALADVDVNGMKLTSVSSSMTLTSMNCLHLSAGEYSLFARNADSFVNGSLPPPQVTYSLALSGNSERLSLWIGDAGIDSASFFASSSGKSWQLDPDKLDSIANDDPNNFCKATVRWGPDGGTDYGSPGQPNPPCPADAGPPGDLTQCFDEALQVMRHRRSPVPGDLVITELMPDPAAVSDSVGEWFEVHINVEHDLNGLVLASETRSTRIDGANCLVATADSDLMFARSADSALNGQLPAVTATFAFDLANSGTRVLSVFSADGGVLDQLSYTGATAGASTQLSAGLTQPQDNDVPTNLCATPTSERYGAGDRGTPGRRNPTTCP